MKNNQGINNINPNEWLIKANETVRKEGVITDIIRINEHQVRARVSDSSTGSRRVVYYDYIDNKMIDRSEIDRQYLPIINEMDNIEQNGNCVMAFSIDGDRVAFRIFNDANREITTEIREIRRNSNWRGKYGNDKSNRSRHSKK